MVGWLARDRLPYPFPAAPARGLADRAPEMGYRQVLTSLLPTCQCRGKMIASLIPSGSHEINITWQFL